MPVPSANQGIPEQQGADPANLPAAQVSWDGVMENRLFQRYTNDADRTARNPAPNENESSALAAEDRVDIFNGSAWVSLLHRAHLGAPELLADVSLAPSSTAMQDVTGLLVPVPTAGRIWWEAMVFYDSSTTADIKFAYTWPAGVTNARWGGIGVITGGTSSGDANFATSSASDGAVAYGSNGVGSVLFIVMQGRMTMGGTSGNLQMRAAQNTSDATAITIRVGSRLRVWRTA